MSAAISTGYVKRPTYGMTPSSFFSLYATARSSRPIPVTVASSQESSVTSGRVRLAEERRLVGIEAEGKVRNRDLGNHSDIAALWIVVSALVVRDEVEGVLLQRDVLLDGSEVVAEVRFPDG